MHITVNPNDKKLIESLERAINLTEEELKAREKRTKECADLAIKILYKNRRLYPPPLLTPPKVEFFKESGIKPEKEKD